MAGMTYNMVPPWGKKKTPQTQKGTRQEKNLKSQRAILELDNLKKRDREGGTLDFK
jgi:hypothetical protein